ncbi:MAG: nuclear transport factor 2 family protein, partial [Polyangia bacterium]
MVAERRLLVVEPDEELREVLREIVSDLGIVVDAVADLGAAEVELGSSVYALVLADVDARPYDFAAGATRLVRAAAPVRVVAMTALPFDEVGAARAGVVAVLPKPFSVEQLVALVAAELPSDPDHDCRVLVDAYFDSLARGDWDALGALCTADVVYELPGESRFSATVRGRAAFREFSATTFREFPEPSFTVQHLLPIVDG